MDAVVEERGRRVEALPPGSAHRQRSSGPRRPPSLGGAPVGPGHAGTSLRPWGQTPVTSLESSNRVLKSLKHSHIFPVSAPPEICPPEAKVTGVTGELLGWAARVLAAKAAWWQQLTSPRRSSCTAETAVGTLSGTEGGPGASVLKAGSEDGLPGQDDTGRWGTSVAGCRDVVWLGPVSRCELVTFFPLPVPLA